MCQWKFFVLGVAALWLTPREEDPQIVVPLADIYVNFPGHSAAQVEQLIATPLERILYQIDGVEFVYSMSREGQAIITVRYYVGEDRERSLVKLYKKIDESCAPSPESLMISITCWVSVSTRGPAAASRVPCALSVIEGREGDQHAYGEFTAHHQHRARPDDGHILKTEQRPFGGVIGNRQTLYADAGVEIVDQQILVNGVPL